jgi:site-specific DNA-methyltransferase (cytosine-N4-specific)
VVYLGDSLDYMAQLPEASVDLIVTSPPFGLVRKKDYGNVDAHEYVGRFRPFGREFNRILKPAGFLVIDDGAPSSRTERRA